MDDLIAQIEDELARLGLDDEFLCTPAPPPYQGPGPARVALDDNQATTVFEAAPLLAALRACPADATYDAVWDAILPWMVEE